MALTGPLASTIARVTMTLLPAATPPMGTASEIEVPVVALAFVATSLTNARDGQDGGGPPTHVPPLQTSPVVHAFPSVHAAPFDFAGSEQAPVAGLHVPASWHTSLAVHTTGFDPVQTPLSHVSACVQAFPSLHTVPLGFAGFEQTPVAGLHVPASWHASLAVQAVDIGPVHTALRHRPSGVQASLHTVPSGATGFEQVPVVGSHVPATWHASLAEHTTGFAPVHTPLWHASVRVQASPSAHAVPSGAAGFEQIPVSRSHVPTTWHASLAVQIPGFEHVPVAGEQIPAVWHRSLAVHTTGFPPVHTPFWHVSVCEHAFPSLHTVPVGAPAQGPVAQTSTT